jgi:palmitoyltransferase
MINALIGNINAALRAMATPARMERCAAPAFCALFLTIYYHAVVYSLPISNFFFTVAFHVSALSVALLYARLALGDPGYVAADWESVIVDADTGKPLNLGDDDDDAADDVAADDAAAAADAAAALLSSSRPDGDGGDDDDGGVAASEFLRERFVGPRGAATSTVCAPCSVEKPARAHHCRHCRRCVRRFDHHCVFLNNCVGYANHRLFALLLVHGLLFATTALWLLVNRLFLTPWTGDNLSFGAVVGVVVALAGAALAFALASSNLRQQWPLFQMNLTTVEQMHAAFQWERAAHFGFAPPDWPETHQFDHGEERNFAILFGRRDGRRRLQVMWRWLWPFGPSFADTRSHGYYWSANRRNQQRAVRCLRRVEQQVDDNLRAAGLVK